MCRLGIENFSIPPSRPTTLFWSALERPWASSTMSEVVAAAGAWLGWAEGDAAGAGLVDADGDGAAARATVGTVKIVDVTNAARTKSDANSGRRLRPWRGCARCETRS
jgi:hypothetical protein